MSKLPKTFGSKSTKPGIGGRAAILKSKGEAPGQSGFHGGKKAGRFDHVAQPKHRQ